MDGSSSFVLSHEHSEYSLSFVVFSLIIVLFAVRVFQAVVILYVVFDFEGVCQVVAGHLYLIPFFCLFHEHLILCVFVRLKKSTIPSFDTHTNGLFFRVI